MAQHGYLRDYDEGWDRGRDRDDREHSWRDDDDRQRGSSWRDRDYGSGDRDRNFMFGDRSGRDHDRGFFDRMGDEARSWFRDDDRQYRGNRRNEHSSQGYGREHGFGGSGGDYNRSRQDQGRFGSSGDWERSPRNFSSHQDDHYRSWRDRQMSALDQDYQDYCREREQQFHSDFDSWRKNRRSQTSSGQAGSGGGQAQRAQSGSSPAAMELTEPAVLSTEPQSGSNPTADATLGTNNSENSGIGRARR